MKTEDLMRNLRSDPEFGRFIRSAESRSRWRRWLLLGAAIAVPLAFGAGRWATPKPQGLVEFVCDARHRMTGGELIGAAAAIIATVGPDHALYEASISVVGRAGPSTQADEWMRPALSHPDHRVRRAAVVWYPHIRPDWRDDPSTRLLYESAVTSLSGN